MARPFIAIPIGDPAGIGPEIVAKAVADKDMCAAAKCVVIGDKKIMEGAIRITKVPLSIRCIENPEDGDYRENVLNLIDFDNIIIIRFIIAIIHS